MTLQNPYLEAFLRSEAQAWTSPHRTWVQVGRSLASAHQAREDLVTQYSWAIPSEEAIRLLASYSPLLEIGAGTGYWASLIEQVGGEIIAYDAHPPGGSYGNAYGHIQTYTTVHEMPPTTAGVAEVIQQHPGHTLFLCWPPYTGPMAWAALRAYGLTHGHTFLYIGEDEGGCTGDERFWRLLHRSWEQQAALALPQWPWIHDSLRVYSRRPRRAKKSGRDVDRRCDGTASILLVHAGS